MFYATKVTIQQKRDEAMFRSLGDKRLCRRWRDRTDVKATVNRMVRLLSITTAALLSNALLPPASAFYVSSKKPPQHLGSTARRTNQDIESTAAVGTKESITSTRREALVHTVTSVLIASCSSLLGLPPQPAQSADDKEGMVSQPKLASLLKQVPTFAIVDPNGVPYFVVGEDAKLTSYFFLEYGEAKRILDVAITSSDKAIRETKKEIKAKKGALSKEDEEDIGTNPWKNARITSVPLDLAVSLCSKGKLAGAYFRLAPSESDIEDALAVDGTDDLPEGRVPLFYVEDMTISEGAETISPLYFQKAALISEWKRQQKKQQSSSAAGGKEGELPNVKVTELFATITEMIRPDGTDEELKTVQFVPPADSKARAEKCRKGEKEPFRLGERLVVL